MKKPVFYLSFVFIFCLALPAISQSDKKPLDHSVYDDWKNLQRQQLSPDGKWATYEINPQVGDGWLYLVNLETNETDSMPRGTRAVFSADSGFLAYLINPSEEAIDSAEEEGRSRAEMPKSELAIRLLEDRQTTTIENVKSFTLPEQSSPWIVYLLEKDPENEAEGEALEVHNPFNLVTHRFGNVTGYDLSANGELLALIRQEGNDNDKKQSSVKVFNTGSLESAVVFEEEGESRRIITDKAGTQAAFLFTGDAEAPHVYDVFHWQEGRQEATRIVRPGTAGMKDGWSASAYASLRFTDDGSRLFFGTAPVPTKEAIEARQEDNEDTHRLDVWHYEDPLIQPMQLVQKDQELRRTYAAVFHIDDGRMVQLADEDMPEVTTRQYGNGQIEMGESLLPYLIPNSFESGDYRDVYLVDVTTGEKELILEKHRGSVHRSTTGDPRLSPEGQYLLYYNQDERDWYAMSLETRIHVNLTEAIPHPVWDELHDAPSEPDPHGIAGWMEDDSYILIYDRFDIWRVDPTGNDAPEAVTNGYGRDNNIRFRYVDLDPDTDHIGRRDDIMLSAFHLYTKQSGFYHARVNRSRNPQLIVMDDVRYYTPEKAKEADRLLWRKSTFEMYPDLWASDINFRNPQQISVANPQQSDYRWGNVELVEWVSFANDTLQGLLYTPEDMDPDKKYPMIVFFYERSSDGLHNHQVPAPSRSTINRSYSVSNGYVVFMTDIPYTVGYPGQSAYNSIVSGTKAMTNQFDFIDRENIGIQGQSWAGYQIAWLITQTDMFKAAMAGAPVSNMISAYGGIRWSTGMSRIYQYEQTQSRIGGTIWDETLRYIENSPVFFANKVNTPLMMMHNDADGAVPWYQGIEYFMALRRLGKPVWMLNYNDEAHNLTRRPNMMDLSVRMYQFFDHYLKGEPAPVWMKEGVPAVRKGIDDGYELVE